MKYACFLNIFYWKFWTPLVAEPKMGDHQKHLLFDRLLDGNCLDTKKDHSNYCSFPDLKRAYQPLPPPHPGKSPGFNHYKVFKSCRQCKNWKTKICFTSEPTEKILTLYFFKVYLFFSFYWRDVISTSYPPKNLQFQSKIKHL